MLFLKYYYDVTKFNLIVSVGIGILTESAKGFLISFGTFGGLISFLAYKQFKNNEYYFYLNQGYIKSELFLKVFITNFVIAFISFMAYK